MGKNNKIPPLTPAMRASLKLKILRTAKEHPEFEKELLKRMEDRKQGNQETKD